MAGDEKTWLTPSAHQKLVEELSQLKTVGRIAIEKRIAEARDHGDLRENAEYDTAKNDQGLMEARIRQISHTLENFEISNVQDSEQIRVGTIATLLDESGDEVEFFIASAENKVPGFVLTSPGSPLGQALLGAVLGDVVTYEAPLGTFTYTVTGIRAYDN